MPPSDGGTEIKIFLKGFYITMNTALNNFLSLVKYREIAVIGIGISNRPLIKYLAENGAHVTACDRRTKEDLGEAADELLKLGVKLELGDGYIDNLTQDIIFKTPGMRFDVPQLEAARKRGALVTSEMEAFFDVCPCKIIAVTGSDGKTTTTTLINKMLVGAGYNTWLGGNIGNPLLCDTGKMKEDDIVVLELSSFQLHTMRKSPYIAVITNISPNHLDMHKDYREYIDAKKNIMLYQKPGDILVTNSANEETEKIGKEAKGEQRGFSSKGDALIHLENECIYYGDEEILNIKDIKLPGMHNVENYMAAIGAVHDMVSADVIRKIAAEFGGVEHRLEFVRELDGVSYYNSSIDSSPNRTINALSVFKNKIILIAGGKDKGIPYDAIGEPIEEHVKTLVLIGATSDKIYDAVMKNAESKGTKSAVKILRADSYEQAVGMARENAQKGDVVLLSPASTSFDRFRNFEERGRLFKKIVNEL